MAKRNDHDQNFKNLILDYPQQALAFFSPTEAPARDDRVRILPVREQQLKERLGNRYRELDVPLLVEWEDGRREALLFALEEETNPYKFSIHRLAHYCLDLSELCKTTRVVPVVVFLNTAQSIPQSLSLGSERHQHLVFDYLACHLSTIPYEDWQHSDNIVARLNLPNMRWSPEQKVQVYAQAMRGLMSLEPDLNKRAKYVDFIDIYAKLTDNERQRYELEYPEENAIMAGFAERFREEGLNQGMRQGMQKGIQKGIQKGVQQGRLEGERTVLERLLMRRFGPLSPHLSRRLEQASTTELEKWADKVLDARRLDDVFAD